jgi:hypothetical protein
LSNKSSGYPVIVVVPQCRSNAAPGVALFTASASRVPIETASHIVDDKPLSVDEGISSPIQRGCFAMAGARRQPMTAMSVRLDTRQCEALAELLPVLLCGEESAVLAFGGYVGSAALQAAARKEFCAIQSDEERHTTWLQRLKLGLPAPRSDPGLLKQVRRFFAAVREPQLGRHLGRIAALDSAACLVLGALRRRRGAIWMDRTLSNLFGQIHRDEVRHVAIAHNYAKLLCDATDLRTLAVDTRESLTRLLARRGDALEQLGVCPDALLRRLVKLPRNLFW